MECAKRHGRGQAGPAYRMNCFRHPDEVAIVFCKACRVTLCRECSQQSIRGVTQVCSDECAQSVRRRPGAKSFIDNVYAGVFLILLLAFFGGGNCVLLAHSGRTCWDRQQSSEYYPARDRYGGLEVDL